MKLEMICTGEEVLSGQIVDTNAAWFANAMMDEGIEVQRKTTVGDRLADLIDIFIERSHHADVILVNGGLGPTSDDLSAEAMAQAIGEPLVENQYWRQQVQAFYQQRGRDMPATNLKQAMLPQSAIMVDNPVGTACGFRIKLNRAWLFFTPGVPFEFKQMVQEQFIPFLKQEFATDTALQPTQVLKLLTLGVGESNLQELVQQLHFPEGITLGYRASMPYVEIKVFARGNSAISALPLIEQSLMLKLGTLIVARDLPSLSLWLHQHLLEHPQTIALAESCTGGLLTSQLVAFSGSSAYLTQGLVTYSNEAKVKVLAVKPQTLDNFGAVSIATAEEMAQGARALLDVDFALSTTGIAGPDGGSEQKPVGTVAIALATRTQTYSQMLLFPNYSRLSIQQFSCAVAYDMLRRALLEQEIIVDYPSVKRLDNSKTYVD